MRLTTDTFQNQEVEIDVDQSGRLYLSAKDTDSRLTIGGNVDSDDLLMSSGEIEELRDRIHELEGEVYELTTLHIEDGMGYTIKETQEYTTVRWESVGSLTMENGSQLVFEQV